MPSMKSRSFSLSAKYRSHEAREMYVGSSANHLNLTGHESVVLLEGIANFQFCLCAFSFEHKLRLGFGALCQLILACKM